MTFGVSVFLARGRPVSLARLRMMSFARSAAIGVANMVISIAMAADGMGPHAFQAETIPIHNEDNMIENEVLQQMAGSFRQ